MNRLSQWLKRHNFKILGMGSIFIGLPLILSPITLAQTQYLNDRYQENNVREIPLREPIPVSTPSPENTIKADASINPNDNTIDIKLQNQTNALITYQVIGHTGEVIIRGSNEDILLDIPLPATVTLIREDDGLLKVMPMSSDSDMLNVVLEEDKNFDDVQGTLRIQEDGQVFVY